jgi:1-phosphatidylinositol phosphodiesterase
MRVSLSTLGLLVALALPLTSLADATNWMTLLDSRLSLTQLSIPGTHDAGARLELIPGTAKCQELTLAQQLDAGVRFLDIRCRHVTNTFLIHHGMVYQNLTFDDVLADVTRFLAANAGECVILSIKQEYDPKGNTRTFEQTFDAYVAKAPERWLLSDRIPTLAEARGRIVLFRRFRAAKLPKGIDASVWPDNASFTAGALRVQDIYHVPDNGTKWAAIQSLLNEAKNGSSTTFYINFASGSQTTLGIPSITAVSKDINPRLAQHLADTRHARLGIILLDFAEPALCAAIWQSQVP